MTKLPFNELIDLYLDRVFDSSDDLESEKLEAIFFAEYGWTIEEFDEHLARQLINESDICKQSMA